jgi:hypothetical protein
VPLASALFALEVNKQARQGLQGPKQPHLQLSSPFGGAWAYHIQAVKALGLISPPENQQNPPSLQPDSTKQSQIHYVPDFEARPVFATPRLCSISHPAVSLFSANTFKMREIVSSLRLLPMCDASKATTDLPHHHNI